jgi:uncharacterized phage protein (TIGR01671 family)
LKKIKIRVFNHTEGKMVYKNLFDRNWYYTPKNTKTGCNTAYACETNQETRHSEPMLFTGFKDKKGKDIYEDDIIRLTMDGDDHGLQAIDWSEQAGAFTVKFDFGDYDETAIGWAIGGDNAWCLEAEVVGNIYQNADLLKVSV